MMMAVPRRTTPPRRVRSRGSVNSDVSTLSRGEEEEDTKDGKRVEEEEVTLLRLPIKQPHRTQEGALLLAAERQETELWNNRRRQRKSCRV